MVAAGIKADHYNNFHLYASVIDNSVRRTNLYVKDFWGVGSVWNSIFWGVF